MYKASVYTNLMKSRLITKTPVVLTHLITSLCNCKCKTCDNWKLSPEYTNDLTKEDIFRMLDDAAESGFISYNVCGGEPLLRNDLPEILKHAKDNGLINSVITNGFLLKKRYKDIAPFLDYLLVSLDSNDSLHDKMRGIKGIRERTIEGIKLCKKDNVKVSINSVISKLNLSKIDGLMKLSRTLDVPITFEPMQAIKGYNEKIEASEKELKRAFEKIIKYKKKGFRVGNSYQYLSKFCKQNKYTCHAPKVFIAVKPHGDIITCIDVKWGNVKNTKFRELFRKKKFKEFCKISEKCNKCVTSCVIETSIAYSVDISFFLDKFKNLL